MRSKLSDLPLGAKAIVHSFTDERMSVKLLEMGCLPGEWVEVTNIAPFGDPIAIIVSGYKLSLRLSEAATILVK